MKFSSLSFLLLNFDIALKERPLHCLNQVIHLHSRLNSSLGYVLALSPLTTLRHVKAFLLCTSNAMTPFLLNSIVALSVDTAIVIILRQATVYSHCTPYSVLKIFSVLVHPSLFKNAHSF